MKEVTITICNTQFKVFLFPDGDIKLAPVDLVKAVNNEDSPDLKAVLENDQRQPLNPLLTGVYFIEEAKKQNMMATHLLLFCVAKVIEDAVYEAEVLLNRKQP